MKDGIDYESEILETQVKYSKPFFLNKFSYIEICFSVLSHPDM